MENATARPGGQTQRLRLLVVGDWLVDEHWVTGIHRSPTSSRRGGTHYRALHTPRTTTKSFCGAGRSASVLFGAAGPSGHLFSVAGLGLWHPRDTDILSALLNPTNLVGYTLHQLNQQQLTPEPRGLLFNLADLAAQGDDSGPGLFGTTRIIRIYQQTGDDLELLQRLDWEVHVEQADLPWEVDPSLLAKPALKEFLRKNGEPNAVVIKDSRKGVVSSTLLNHLRSALPNNLPWFVSTKAWKPEWLDLLKDVNLRLFLVPPVAADSAVAMDEVTAWITKTGSASKSALRMLDNIAGRLGDKPSLTLVVLPSSRQLLGRAWTKGTKTLVGVVEAGSIAKVPRTPTPMASVFFGALVAELLAGQNSDVPWANRPVLVEALNRCLGFTREWREFEAKRVEDVDNWTPVEEPVWDPTIPYERSANGDDFDWEEENKTWERAYESEGIVGTTLRPQLQLWRSMTEVDRYVCCVGSKRKSLRTLLALIRSFQAEKPRRNKSCLVVARPGSGKTHLVRCLAKEMRMLSLRFNITQMLSKDHILDSFDTIVTTQAQNPGETLLVFVDEINARIRNESVYDSFLAPLDEQVYVRAGKVFHIDPCVWIFAGTRRATEDEDSPKASDFESRLTIREIRLEADTRKEQNGLKLEKVYLGAALLRAVYPDVRTVSERVLCLFRELRADLEVRDLTNLIRAFVDIQYGQVVGRNVPLAWLRNYRSARDGESIGIDIDEWVRNRNEGRMVELVGPGA